MIGFTPSKSLKRGMTVRVDSSYNRAVTPEQEHMVVEVAYAYPAGSNPGQYAATTVEFTNGHKRDYRTNANWIVESV